MADDGDECTRVSACKAHRLVIQGALEDFRKECGHGFVRLDRAVLVRLVEGGYLTAVPDEARDGPESWRNFQLIRGRRRARVVCAVHPSVPPRRG